LSCKNTVEHATNSTEYFVSLQTSVFITEEYKVVVNSGELIGTVEYLTL